MIESLSVSNYKSIRDTVLIDFSKKKEFNAIFGKINSGKSLIFESINIFIHIFKHGFKGLKNQEIDETTNITVSFLINQNRYVYSLSFNLYRMEISHESLSVIKYKDEKNLFIRETNSIKTSNHFNKLFNEFDFERITTYMYDLSFDKRSSILSNISNKGFSLIDNTFFIDQISVDIENIINFDINENISIFTGISDKHYKMVLTNIKKLIPDVLSLNYKKLDLDDLRQQLNRHRYDHLMDKYRNHLISNNDEICYIYAYGHLYIFKGKDFDLFEVSSIEVNFKNNLKLLFHDVSSGIKQMFLLMIMIFRDNSNVLYLFDDMFLNIDSVTASQLVNQIRPVLVINNSKILFATKDLMLFDLELFKKEELSVLIKNDFIKLKYLDSYKIRTDKKILNLFMSGFFNLNE